MIKLISMSAIVTVLLSGCGGNTNTYDNNITALQATPEPTVMISSRTNPDQLGEQYRASQSNIPIVPENALLTPVNGAYEIESTINDAKNNKIKNNKMNPIEKPNE